MKRIVCLTLAAFLAIGCFSACDSTAEPTETTQTVPTEPAGEATVSFLQAIGHKN